MLTLHAASCCRRLPALFTSVRRCHRTRVSSLVMHDASEGRGMLVASLPVHVCHVCLSRFTAEARRVRRRLLISADYFEIDCVCRPELSALSLALPAAVTLFCPCFSLSCLARSEGGSAGSAREKGNGMREEGSIAHRSLDLPFSSQSCSFD